MREDGLLLFFTKQTIIPVGQKKTEAGKHFLQSYP